jgi:DNA-binding SARP family transcriptional activator/tetratricopeptide (TPR) repeat protein
VRFRVLGPVDAYVGDERLALGGPKPRLLLAALLTEPGRVVPTERIVDIVWGDNPPETSRALIHTYISSLRRVLNRPGAEEVIVTRPPGYLVRVGPDELDSAVFERVVGCARQDAQAGRHAEAAEQFRTGERLWQGAAYGGIGESPLAAEAARLDELRLAAIDERITSEKALGRNDDLVVELTALVGTNPTHERLRAHLMVVLYRLGRQADALATYRQGREALIEELGIEPGPELRRIHDAILRGEPELLGPPTKPPVELAVSEPGPPGGSSTADLPRPEIAALPRPEIPAQLPGFPADFTGRTAEIAELQARLLRQTDAPTACVIAGKGGAGKSTLALRVAHEISDRFDGGQLYAELRGTTDTPAQPVEVLGRFLRALGVDPATLPESLDERVERFRTAVAGRRILVVLDDAANEPQVRPLLPGGAANAVVVTSRRRLAGLAGAIHVELDVLDTAAATTMLARIAGEERVVAEPAAAQQIVALCGCLPLAVRIVGARLATRRHWTLESMAGRLADERRRLDELSVADQQVRAGIEISYRGLDLEAQSGLRGLGTLGLPDFPGWVVGCLLNKSIEDGEEIVDQLVDAQLIDFARVDAVGQMRYRLHELVGVYARERASLEDEPDIAAASIRRVVGCWLWLIGQISDSAPTGAIPLNPPMPELYSPDPAIAKPILASPGAWLDAEQEMLVTAVERAASLDLADVSVALATALCGSVFAVGNLFESWARTHAAALTAARRAGDRAAEATLLVQLGQLRCDQDRYSDSHEYLIEALTIFRDLGDQRGEATALAALGSTCREQGRLKEAMHFLRQAHGYFQTNALDPGIGFAGRLIGSTRLEQGEFTTARADLVEAVTAYRRFGCRRGEALTLRSLSLVHRAIGELDEAHALSVEALTIFGAIGDELLEAYAQQSLAKTLIRLGRGEEALGMLDEAQQTCGRLGDQWGEAFVLRTRGELHLAAGRWAAADADLTESRRRWIALDVPLFRARTERDLAALRTAEGNPSAAEELRSTAMETFRIYGAREYRELGLTDDL